jgi:hypothetical protein
MKMSHCPFCYEHLSLLQLRAHVASHLEEITLSILHTEVTGQDENAGSNQEGSLSGGETVSQSLKDLVLFSRSFEASAKTPENHQIERWLKASMRKVVGNSIK